MDILLIILGVLCLLTGFLGCIIPALPGPPISYVGMLLLHFTNRIQFLTVQLLVWLGLVVLTLILDYVIPMWGSRYSGGTKWGSWGAFIGSIIGLFFLPYGLLLGPFLGAMLGELLGDRDLSVALKSGLGSLLGFLFGTILKVVLCAYFIIVFFSSLW